MILDECFSDSFDGYLLIKAIENSTLHGVMK